MKWLFLTPFVLQPLLIAFDEGYFHIKRGLPRFERIGHPLDTLTVIGCFMWLYFIPYHILNFTLAIIFSVFSCLFVTKDEFVHNKYCPATEQWLHAVLFLNHPVLLGFSILLWLKQHSIISWPAFTAEFIHPFIGIQLLMAILFGLYQVIYWNFMRKKEPYDC